MISVCCFVAKGMVQTQTDGAMKVMDFIDEQRMSHLYEKFILEYYKREWKELSATASQIPWQLDDGYKEWLPVSDYELIPDVDIENYLPGDPSSAEYVSEICIPVRKKE